MAAALVVEVLPPGDPAVADAVAACAALERLVFPEGGFDLQEEHRRPHARILVARRGDEVTGFLLAWLVVDELHVLTVATAPATRRTGVGAALVAAARALARDAKATRLLLEVRRSNRAAIGLYQGAGYHVFNVRKRYYADGEDGVEMHLRLDPTTFEPIPDSDDEPP